jgi:hypothetical protein
MKSRVASFGPRELDGEVAYLMEVASLFDHDKTTTGTEIAAAWALSLHAKCDDFSLLFDMGSS